MHDLQLVQQLTLLHVSESIVYSHGFRGEPVNRNRPRTARAARTAR